LESIIREIRSNIEAVEGHTALYEETNFSDRAEALDFLESDVIDRIEGLFLKDGWSQALTGLKQYAETVRTRLEGVDKGLFRRLRQEIASGDCTSAELRQRIAGYAGDASRGGRQADEGYDSLDALVNGLLLTEVAPEGPSQRDPEMFFYQPTPARIVLEMVDTADFRQHDVFYDIGSGLGQVSILVHLLTGIRAKGVEVEPAYCDYARRCAGGLSLTQVQFITVDAREADYSDGTIFFLYTPFEGRMLERVLERIRHVSTKRKIRLYTYGACTLQVTRQRWLERLDQNGNQVNRLAMFTTAQRGLEAAQQLAEAEAASARE
jgi:SAM-dependent methyltransferase